VNCVTSRTEMSGGRWFGPVPTRTDEREQAEGFSTSFRMMPSLSGDCQLGAHGFLPEEIVRPRHHLSFIANKPVGLDYRCSLAITFPVAPTRSESPKRFRLKASLTAASRAWRQASVVRGVVGGTVGTVGAAGCPELRSCRDLEGTTTLSFAFFGFLTSRPLASRLPICPFLA
jgi:hypothetical protein